MQVRKVKNKNKVDITKYVNSETGELLIDEVEGDASLSITSESDTVIVSSKNYAVIDEDAVMYLMSVLNNSDFANVMKMAITTKTPLNIIYNNNIPHTNETLKRYLSLNSKSMYNKMVNRLINEGILYQIKGKVYGKVRVIYMLNPYVTRKRKTFDSKVFDVFSKLKINNTQKP